VLTEELGEIARVICEVDLHGGWEVEDYEQLRKELIQLGAMTAAWADATSDQDTLRKEARYRTRKVTSTAQDEPWGPWSRWLPRREVAQVLADLEPNVEIDTEYTYGS
jgi:hypothetical protein